MRRILILALMLATTSARGQGAGIRYYYSPNPADDICSGGPGASCSIVECNAVWNCACPLVLPNGWKRPLSKAQCETARGTLPLLPIEEIRRRLGYEPPKKEAAPKPTSSPRSEAAKKIPDDEMCQPIGGGGGGTMKSPATCRYICGRIEICVELDPPRTVCPGDQGPVSPIRWKSLKTLRPCRP